jgi:hypothetical protein
MNAEERFTEFVAAWERGERPDPAKAIVVAGEADREPLAAMITAYLAAHPRTDVTADELAARAADPRSQPPPEAWPELLPRLRERTRTTRGALIAALAAALGFPDATEQVEEHVHALETGQLEPRAVRPAVVSALARILEVPEWVLERGRRITPPAAQMQPLALFRRESHLAASMETAPTPPGEVKPIPEIDDLFTGADG